MKTQTKQLRVKEGKTELTELTVDHKGEDITFIYPALGPNSYVNVEQQIEQAELKKSTMAETASLVHTAFNSDDKYSLEIKKIIKEKWLWAFTGVLYVPNKGAYIQDNPEIKKEMLFMNESDLVKRLEANDKSVRFTPFGFKTESMSSSELAKNEFVIALAGEEGAERLAETSDKFKEQPFLGSFKSVDETLTRVSALGSSWFSDYGLDVGGDHGYRLGYSFGYASQKSSTGNKAQ
mgnify:CR=1 FL=1